MSRSRILAVLLLFGALGMALEAVRIAAGDRALQAHVEAR
jgi:hypothetical protein